MLKLVHIKVECFAGYKADEYPKYFQLDGNRFEIYEIADRWYQTTSTPENPVSNYFKVETTCGQEFIIKHDLESDEWFLCN
jgi:hypothetical protein